MPNGTATTNRVFGRAAKDRIVRGQPIKLELQEIDEHLNRIRDSAGKDTGGRLSSQSAKEVLLNNASTVEPLNLNSEELAILAELLETQRSRLLIEIRHAHHRTFRDELRRRLALVEKLAECCRSRAV